MENIELFQALENLKKTLSEINSAKDQVDSIIQSFAGVQTTMTKYTNSIKPISTQLHEIISAIIDKQETLSVQAASILDSVNSTLNNNVVQLTQTCDSIKSSFENQTKKISVDFKKTILDEIDKLNVQNEKLGASIVEISNVGENIKVAKSKIEEVALSVSDLKKEITLSQKSQDVELLKISKKIGDSDSTTNTKLLEISNNVSNNYNDLISHINNISTSINKIIQYNSNFDSKVNTLHSIVSDIKSNLNSFAPTINDTAKNITSIKKMVIVSIVLSIISILINFI